MTARKRMGSPACGIILTAPITGWNKVLEKTRAIKENTDVRNSRVPN